MTINAADIKLLASERMTDTTDGGGRRTANVIVDGIPGNIFPKVSRLDSVYGRVNLRKVFGAVQTPSLDTYAGAHAAIMDAPDNEDISVAIFSMNSDFDDRTAARDRIESYVVSGPESKMTMYGRQLVGQGAVTVYQRVEETLPEVGDVYCLSNEANDITAYQQFVRVQDVTHEVRTFTDDGGDFQRRIITLKIGSTLRYEFDGLDVPSRQTVKVKNAVVRSTTVADAARYYGIKPLTGGVLAEVLTLKVSSIFAPIVPTALREAPIANAQIGGSLAIQATAPAMIDWRYVGVETAVNAVGTQTINLGTAVLPGSLQVRIDAADFRVPPVSFNQATTDDGKGVVKTLAASGITDGSTIDYENGLLVVNYSWGGGPGDNWNGFVWVRYIPAVSVSQPSHTLEQPVTIATRGTVQVITLNPIPAKGSLIVDYRALGKWYRLRDDGTGTVAGDDPAYGTGTIDPLTGSAVVTLGALPDVGSSIIWSWGSPVHYQIKAGATSDALPKVVQIIPLNQLPAGAHVNVQTMSIQYISGGVTYTATGDANGVLTGGGVTGKIDVLKSQMRVEYTSKLPDPGSIITVGFQQSTPVDPASPLSKTGFFVVAGAGKTFTVPTPIDAGALKITVPVLTPQFAGYGGVLIDVDAAPDANGNLVTLAGSKTYSDPLVTAYYRSPNWSVPGGDIIGTVDLATGVVTLTDGPTVTLDRAYYQYVSGGWAPAQAYKAAVADGNAFFSVNLANAANPSVVSGFTVNVADNPFTLDLTTTTLASVVPGSVMFNAFGKSYFDRNGVLYHTMLPDGTGTVAGSIDYASGTVTLTDYALNTALGLSVTACLTKYGDFTAVKAEFRTAGSPVRPASTFVQVVAVDGSTLTATSDQSGALSGPFARGTANEEMGVVHIEWGSMVAAAGNETQPWYNAADVVGGQIWKPIEVLPSTISYNAVVQTSLPLNADIIGLDPVRLPSDGRVPVFRAGDVIVIHNTKLTALPNPVVAGTTYNVGRTSLADLVLLDAVGARVADDQYVVDLDAGTVTMSAGMNLGAAVQPLQAKHRIEELNLASDVQINGEIELASALSRDFDEDTMVSGALLFGDLFARVSNVFDQVTWTNVWDDARIGSNGASEYDTINHPIEVLNDGSVTERWRINFTSTTAFQVIGENLGQIATGVTTADCSPINQLTGKPYFVLRAAGWGAGWIVGQQLRFNTFGATAPIWMARTVLPGATLAGDSIDIQLRGDVDA